MQDERWQVRAIRRRRAPLALWFHRVRRFRSSRGDHWLRQLAEDWVLHGMQPRTVEGYSLAVRLFLDRVKQDLPSLTEQDVRDYVLHLRDESLKTTEVPMHVRLPGTERLQEVLDRLMMNL